MRLALISTPRSGNTWLNAMLTGLFRLESLAVHNPADVPWDRLPQRLVLQLHWHRVEPLVSQLTRHRFQLLVLVRHPLDVLVSILNFCAKQPETRRWLEGDGGGEETLLGQSPSSQSFVDYATGRRARALLSVSRQWWDAADACRIRYEQLVSATAQELTRIARHVQEEPATPIPDVIAATALDRIRRTSPVHLVHMWQGQPGHWKKFLIAPLAHRIQQAHPELFRSFGYRCDPDESLERAQADANWYRLQAETRSREYQSLSEQLQAANRRHADELQRVQRELDRYTRFDSAPVALGGRLRRIAGRLPGAGRLLRRLAGVTRDTA